MIMDNSEEIERILERMDQRADESSKESIALLRQMAKTMAAMSEESKRSLSEDTKHRRQERMRDDARERRRQQEVKGDKGSGKFGDAFGKSIGKAGKAVDGFTGMLSITTDNLHDLVGVLKLFPVVGGLVATALGTLVVGGIQNTIDSFRLLNKHGIVFGDSIFDINIAAVNAGMSIKEFSELVSKYGVVLNTYGIEGVVNFNKALIDSSSELRKMGMTTRDITAFTLDYLDMTRNLGERTTLKNLQESGRAEKTAKAMMELAMVTGKSIDDLRKTMLASSTDPELALNLRGVNPEDRDKILQLDGNIPGMRGVINDLLLFGGSPALAQIQGFMPKFAAALEQAVLHGGPIGPVFAALSEESKGLSQSQIEQINAGAKVNDEYKILQGLVANGQTLVSNDNDWTEENLKKRRALQEKSVEIDEMVQRFRAATMLPFLTALETFDKKVNLDNLSVALEKLGTAVGNLMATVFTPENIEAMANFTTGFTGVLGDLISFFGPFGLVGVALGFAFGPRLASTLIKTVVKGLGGLLTSGAAAAGGGLVAGGKGLLGMLSGGGKSISTGFLGKLGGLGIGALLAGAVSAAIEGEINGSVVGTTVGTFIGGFLGSFFGPIGTGLGSVIGGILGGAIGEAVAGKKEEFKSEAEQAMDDALAKAKAVQFDPNATPEQRLNAQIEANKVSDQINNNKALMDSYRDYDIKKFMPMIASTNQQNMEQFQQSVMDLEARRPFWAQQLPTIDKLITESHALPDEVLGAMYDAVGGMTPTGLTLKNIEDLKNILEKLAGAGELGANGIISDLKHAKAYARGGIATSASIFGEAGAEAAIPLDSGLRIPIAEIKNYELEQTTVAMLQTMTEVRQSLDRFLKFLQNSDRSAEELDVLVGIYSQLTEIAGSNKNLERNFRSVM